VETATVRFRTVGDMTCTCPVRAPPTAADIVAETLTVTVSERGATRMDDRTSEASMERARRKATSDERLLQAAGRGAALLTAGSVDDGKSTLIGRLLFDSRPSWPTSSTCWSAAPPAPHRPVAADRRPGGRTRAGHHHRRGLPLLRHPTRKFIIADAPGHEQYTRNMVTAAAGSDAAVVLVDITKLDWSPAGRALLPQTRRHSLLAHLLRVPSIVFAVNKIDAVDDPGRGLRQGGARCRPLRREAGIARGRPSCRSARCAATTSPSRWPRLVPRPSLLQVLEGLPTTQERTDGRCCCRCSTWPGRLGRQRGRRPPAARALGPHRPRQPCKAGDAVQVFPSGERLVAALRRAGQRSWTAAGRAVAGLVLDRQLDVSAATGSPAPAACGHAQRFPATLAWLDTEPATSAASTGCATATAGCRRASPPSTTGWTSTACSRTDAHELAVNEIGACRSSCSSRCRWSPMPDNRVGGALIVVDPASHRTSGALLVDAPVAEPAAEEGGRWAFVGAGPGAADLITLRGAQRLAQAEVVLFDALTDPALRAWRPRPLDRRGQARLRPRHRQKPSTRCWCGLARQHGLVVRLKGGDPSVFGRLEEELQALAAPASPARWCPA
jgi:sulfate adenylyltransferase subunit 1